MKVERRFLNVNEIQALAESIDPRYRLLVLLGAYAGLRLGELAALKVSSFGIGYRTVTVTETLTDVRGMLAIGPPKTRASIRTVTLPGFLADEISQMGQLRDGRARRWTVASLDLAASVLGAGRREGGPRMVHAALAPP